MTDGTVRTAEVVARPGSDDAGNREQFAIAASGENG